ncbi:MAG: carboxypeptidase-like regulatory domain-containing protein, partial [Chitinophagaceae bacterium]
MIVLKKVGIISIQKASTFTLQQSAMYGCNYLTNIYTNEFFSKNSMDVFVALYFSMFIICAAGKNSQAEKILAKLPLTIVLFFSLTSLAQKKVSGVVIGFDGLPIAGATVVLTNTNLATITLADGSFIITAKTGDELEISFVGYQKELVKLGNETSLKIFLTGAGVQLDEIIVTGYT